MSGEWIYYLFDWCHGFEIVEKISDTIWPRTLTLGLLATFQKSYVQRVLVILGRQIFVPWWNYGSSIFGESSEWLITNFSWHIKSTDFVSFEPHMVIFSKNHPIIFWQFLKSKSPLNKVLRLLARMVMYLKEETQLVLSPGGIMTSSNRSYLLGHIYLDCYFGKTSVTVI